MCWYNFKPQSPLIKAPPFGCKLPFVSGIIIYTIPCGGQQDYFKTFSSLEPWDNWFDLSIPATHCSTFTPATTNWIIAQPSPQCVAESCYSQIQSIDWQINTDYKERAIKKKKRKSNFWWWWVGGDDDTFHFNSILWNQIYFLNQVDKFSFREEMKDTWSYSTLWR